MSAPPVIVTNIACSGQDQR